MKQTLAYVAGVTAFAAAAFTFAENTSMGGILACLAGILAVIGASRKEPK